MVKGMEKVIIVNEQPHEVMADTIAELVEELKIDIRKVAIERNQVVIKRDDHTSTALHAGDTIEIVEFIGGG